MPQCMGSNNKPIIWGVQNWGMLKEKYANRFETMQSKIILSLSN